MKILFRHTRVFTFLLTLLLLCGVANEAAAGHKVTYHILTKGIDNTIYHMSSALNGKRLEAVRVVDNNATTVELPAAYKSPLAHNFKYYESSNVTKVGPVRMYDWGTKDMTYHYTINDESDGKNKGGSSVTGDMEVYVTYEYNAANGIADLSGTKEEYNLTMSGGFWGFNRGRNNRIGVFKEDFGLVQNKDLVSEDFVQFAYTNNNKVSGTNIASYWQSNDNKNTKSAVAGQFHFIFKFEGSDPYNIIIGTAYNRDYAYLEKHGTENSFRYKWYKGSHLFRPSSDNNCFMSSDDHKEYTKSGTTYDPDPVSDLPYTERSGYFKSKGTADKNYNYSTFALLNSTSTSGGYVFMVSRFVSSDGDLSTPGDYKSASYNYLTRDGDFNNLTYASKTLKDASASYSTDSRIYRVQNYVFKVTKKISGEDLSEPVRVSEYFFNGNPKDFVPDALKRKYVRFTGAYKERELTNQFATFDEVETNATTETIDGKDYKVIWLDYEVNIPFETSATSATYDDLKWYNLHAEKNTRYIASWDGSKIVTRNVASNYPRATHFAFIGDPYDLKIVSRTASQVGETPSALKYLVLNGTLENNATFETMGTTWGIVYDDDTADNKDCFRLKDNSGAKYLHIKNASGDNYPLNGTTASADAVRITVDELPKMNYVYYIMRSDNSIAVWSSGGRHEPSAKLGYNHIPKEIRSPFLEGVALTFYGGTSDEATAISYATAKTPTITYAPDTENGGIQHIVVRYDAFSSSDKKALINNATYNVRLNGQYIYYDSGSGTIKSSATISDNGDNRYNWILGGSDPYAMTIQSGITGGKFITIENWPHADETGVGTSITWSDTAPSSKFIIKASDEDNTYEVMGATGEGNYDAIEETFNFGRPDENTVKMYSDWKYISGSDMLRFELVATSARNVTYRLVDIKNNDELLSVQTRQESSAAPSFPPEYRSPLVDPDKYKYWSSLSEAQNKSGVPRTTVGESGDIYVTYTANNKVDMQGRTMYLMKYALGDQFSQEDGSDGLLPDPSTFVGTPDAKKYKYQAVYPYCNGDGNFFVYGEEQYDIQQQGAASTRTRWAWYVESVDNDPYHVKIFSRQQETYPAGSDNNYNAYFRTYVENYAATDGGPVSNHVVTTLAWPGISGEQGTEYMVLGSAGQFRLVTSDQINDGSTTARRAVNSFEQYWKTWNTIRLKVLGDKGATASPSAPNTVPATPATKVATDAGENNRTYLTDVMKWHSYEQWAYAIRWNDYNKAGDKNKKGWEAIEHWYQTVNMGEGYFDFVPTTIDPVLILLDQHGWEVMRKPLPSSPDDPDKYDKYDAIRLYDSPMVKEYHFWTKASKRSGFHQYHTLDQRVTVDEVPFASTSLSDLPPFDATNVHDAKGNLYDQYVTYVVKDEYVKACNVALSYTDDTVDPADSKKKYSKVTATVTGVPFLIQQGSHFVSATDATTLKNDNEVPAIGGMSQYIITNADKLTTTGDKKNELWYLMPNIDIDSEMGYANYAHAWASDYDRKDKVQTSGFNSWAFDPYNIQISSVTHASSYFVTNATTAEIQEGSILGNGTTNTLGSRAAVNATLVGGMDNRTLQMTNATFMAVQDDAGNMQLMPRFDQEKRLKDFSVLVNADDPGVAQTYTKLYRPVVYNYHIIDNCGNESLRYQGGGDLLPQTPEWFQSLLAKDYKYYAGVSGSTGVNEITESLAGATLTDNNVYVRYSYDETADFYKILQGKWLTMTLSAKNAVYDSGIKEGGSKPDPVNALNKDWQWKFIATSQTDPDPYAVSLYNRRQSGATTVNGKTKFALLNWYDGDGVDPSAYTLAVAGTRVFSYDFVNGASMNAATVATTTTEGNVKSTSCSYNNTDAKIELKDDVQHTYTYKVYTNDDPVNPAHDGKYGVFAVSAEQDYSTAEGNDYVPTLPEEIKSPLLNIDQFKYYGAETDMGDEAKELKNIFGLYDDIVYVRYTAYDLKATEYKVPNVKTVVYSKVARGEESNDAALDIDNKLIYNIIWYDDNMMQSTNGSAITGLASQNLQGDNAFVWQFEGNDPYAIKIKHKSSGKYAVGTDALASTATSTFMLLPSTDSSWEYGVLAKTGDSRHQLSGSGNTLADTQATPTPETPTKFIIFGLSTHKVIYHLVIANIGNTINIPYREEKGGSETTKPINGSTQRDLTTGGGATYQLGTTIHGVNYCVDDGHITLGDPLKVPEQLKRPNCKYFFYVDNIKTDGSPSFQKTAADETAMGSEAGNIASVGYYYYKIGTSTFAYKRVHVTTAKDGETPADYTVDDCTEDDYNNAWQYDDTLNNLYKGLRITEMGTEPELLGKTVLINVEYQFDDGLPTNNGSNFVTAPSQKKWYTWETSDDKLAQYTGAAGFKMLEGHESHYTNDFLWSPVGDPYGFKMYNRYEYKTNGQTTHVMTTEAAPADDGNLELGTDDNKAVYELFAGDTDGYFFVRPMLNNDVAIYNDGGTMKLSATNVTGYTFGLSLEQLKPYYDRAGYVGGLNTAGKDAYAAAEGNLQTIQDVVYDDAYIVKFATGYYRLHSQPDIKDLSQRYLSGYTHKTELDRSIPMHFYERKGVSTTFEALGATGYSKTAATQGQLPINAPEYDPASIFYITGTLNGFNNSLSTINMSTQGLNVIENKMGEGTATSFTLMDIGGAVLLIHDNATPAARKYLCFDQSDAAKIYDIQYKYGTPTDYAKWCLEPANNMGLYIETHSGGEEETFTELWYYSSYCVPFDLLIEDKNTDEGKHSSNAYTCIESESPWNETMLHPKPIGKYNTGTYHNNDYFVPAGTPVLFSTKRATSYIKATIPPTSPSTPISTIFSAKYLEQQLPDWDNSKRVYVFGPKMEGTLDINISNGIVNAVLPSLGNTNVGFHLNANQNKESGLTKASWTRHNYYVLHNKIYYLAGSSGASTRGVQFVPVVFEAEAEATDVLGVKDYSEGMLRPGNVYNLQGRCVATEEMVKDGTWKNNLTPGVYIMSGKKIIVK